MSPKSKNFSPKESSVVFSKRDAIAYGVNAALLLSSIRYWTNFQKLKGAPKPEFVTTLGRLEKQFPYLTRQQLRTAIDKLVTDNAVEKYIERTNRVYGGSCMHFVIQSKAAGPNTVPVCYP